MILVITALFLLMVGLCRLGTVSEGNKERGQFPADFVSFFHRSRSLAAISYSPADLRNSGDRFQTLFSSPSVAR